jgi:hypothetical protein
VAAPTADRSALVAPATPRSESDVRFVRDRRQSASRGIGAHADRDTWNEWMDPADSEISARVAASRWVPSSERLLR